MGMNGESVISNKMAFVETGTKHFDLLSIISDLLSVRSVESFIVIDSTEIEEIILSSIDN